MRRDASLPCVHRAGKQWTAPISRVLQWLLVAVLVFNTFAPALVLAQSAQPDPQFDPPVAADAAAVGPAAPAHAPAAAEPDAPPLPQAEDAQAEDAIAYTPAPVSGGAAATINVQPAALPAGDPLLVTGSGAAGSTHVRLALVTGGQTLGVQDVALDAGGNYSTTLPVSDMFPPGSVQICALPTGLDNAQVVCKTVDITAPPPGSVSGQLPLEGLTAAETAKLNADFRLTDASGATLYSTHLLADGSFALQNVKPGVYHYAVTGETPYLTELGNVSVHRSITSPIELKKNVVCSITSYLHPTAALSANPSRVEFTRNIYNNGLFWTYEEERRPFGLYVSGVPTPVTFTAFPQTTDPVDKVIFTFYGPNNQVIDRMESAAPYAVVFDVGRLPPSRGGVHPTVVVTPVVGGREQCLSLYDIEVMANPMANPYVQPGSSHTTWNANTRAYEFEGVLPYFPGVLPFSYTVATIELLGEIKNEFNTGVAFKGYFDLEGRAHIFLTEAFARAVLLSLPLLEGGELRENVTAPGQAGVEFDIRKPAHMAIPYGPLELYRNDLISIPFKMLIFTYFGIVNAYVSGGVYFGVGLYLGGVMRPLAPALDATLSGVGNFHAELGLSVDLLFGLVEGGGGLGGEVCVSLPLRVLLALEAAQSEVGFDNPLVGGRLYLVLWASAIWGLVKTRTTKTLLSFAQGCPGGVSGAESTAESLPRAPDVFRSPVVASSPAGDMLVAYAENTAPAGATPQVQIMARFQDAEGGEWTQPEAISDPTHSAQSPTVAFVGSNQTPMVAWAENTLTADEAAALGDEDPVGHLRRQEIFYSLWDGQWSAPIRLTDNLVPDGMPKAAGEAEISILAWITDLDGNADTRGDQQIAVSTFDLQTQRFAAPALLSYAPGSLNNDVAAAVDPFGRAYVAWVYDLDADLTTADDRRLEVVMGRDADWASLNPQPLPPRVDSPALTYAPDGLQLAFLVRDPMPDGEVSLLGTNGALWDAQMDNNLHWTANPLRDTAGKQVYGEQPQLAEANAEALLIFRQFDGDSRRGSLGQISMSRLYEINPPTPPLFLTDAPEQQWMQAVAINPINSKALVVHSALGVSAATAAAVAEPLSARQALPAAADGVLEGTDNPVLYLTVENEADPALDPLEVSATAPAPGATLSVTAIVRNVGRRESGEVIVNLYRGASSAGEFLGSAPVPAGLALNATAALVFATVTPATLDAGGQLTYFAELTTSGENVTPANDTASITLGGLSAPSRVELAGSNPTYDGALDLYWSGNEGEYVTGYRLLRADAAAGPWALVGESAVPAFTDTSAVYGQSYCYAAQAYNAQGAFSPLGEATCAPFRDLATFSIFLPAVSKP